MPQHPQHGVEANMQDAVIDTSFDELPNSILLKIFHSLGGEALGRLSTQNQRLRALTQDASLWKAASLRRWPAADVSIYDGCWRSLYRGRAQARGEFLRLVDDSWRRLHALQGCGGASEGPPGEPPQDGHSGGGAEPPEEPAHWHNIVASFFQLQLLRAEPLTGQGGGRAKPRRAEMVHWLASSDQEDSDGEGESARGPAGGAAAGREQAEQAEQRELERLSGAVAAALQHPPAGAALDRHITALRRTLEEYDMWGGGFTNWAQVPPQRSGLQWVLEAARGCLGRDAEALTRLSGMLQWLDDGMESVALEAADLSLPAPPAVPAHHWWYFIHPNYYGDRC